MLNLENFHKAIAAHASWKTRLRAAVISGKCDMSIHIAGADNQCEFGKWLYGPELSAAEKGTEHFRKVRQLHAQFHQAAAKVLQCVSSGQNDEARRALRLEGTYAQASTALTEALINWWRDSLG